MRAIRFFFLLKAFINRSITEGESHKKYFSWRPQERQALLELTRPEKATQPAAEWRPGPCPGSSWRRVLKEGMARTSGRDCANAEATQGVMGWGVPTGSPEHRVPLHRQTGLHATYIQSRRRGPPEGMGVGRVHPGAWENSLRKSP